jgi:hypothetical protein
MSQMFGWLLGQAFQSFDALVEGATDKLPPLVAAYDFTPGTQLFFVGISEQRGPEAWLCATDDTLPDHIDRDEAKASGFWAEPYQLVKLPDHVSTPVPTQDDVNAANFEGFAHDGDTESLMWSLHKHIEMQRHTALPDSVGGIGGWGQVTSIYPHYCIEQKILCFWSDDKVGGKIRPRPLDWARWHRDNPKPGSTKLRLVGA